MNRHMFMIQLYLNAIKSKKISDKTGALYRIENHANGFLKKLEMHERIFPEVVNES